MRDCCHFLQKSAPLSRGTAEDKRGQMRTALLSSYTCGCRKRRYAILSSLVSFSNLQTAPKCDTVVTFANRRQQTARLPSLFSFSNIQTAPMCDTVVTFEAPMLQNAKLLSLFTKRCTTLAGNRRGQTGKNENSAP